MLYCTSETFNFLISKQEQEFCMLCRAVSVMEHNEALTQCLLVGKLNQVLASRVISISPEKPEGLTCLRCAHSFYRQENGIQKLRYLHKVTHLA